MNERSNIEKIHVSPDYFTMSDIADYAIDILSCGGDIDYALGRSVATWYDDDERQIILECKNREAELPVFRLEHRGGPMPVFGFSRNAISTKNLSQKIEASDEARAQARTLLALLDTHSFSAQRLPRTSRYVHDLFDATMVDLSLREVTDNGTLDIERLGKVLTTPEGLVMQAAALDQAVAYAQQFNNTSDKDTELEAAVRKRIGGMIYSAFINTPYKQRALPPAVEKRNHVTFDDD